MTAKGPRKPPAQRRPDFGARRAASVKTAGVNVPPRPAGPQPSGGSKRTLVLSLLALGAGAVTINSVMTSREEGRAPRSYAGIADCEKAHVVPPEECSRSFEEARKSHDANAPMFATREACEQQYGVGNCGNPATASDPVRRSYFIPAMTGYLIGRRTGGGWQASGLYRRPGDPDGELRASTNLQPFTPSGSSSSWTWSSRSGYSGGSYRSSSSYRPASSSRSSFSRSSVSRGGFGSSGRGFSGS